MASMPVMHANLKAMLKPKLLKMISYVDPDYRVTNSTTKAMLITHIIAKAKTITQLRDAFRFTNDETGTVFPPTPAARASASKKKGVSKKKEVQSKPQPVPVASKKKASSRSSRSSSVKEVDDDDEALQTFILPKRTVVYRNDNDQNEDDHNYDDYIFTTPDPDVAMTMVKLYGGSIAVYQTSEPLKLIEMNVRNVKLLRILARNEFKDTPASVSDDDNMVTRLVNIRKLYTVKDPRRAKVQSMISDFIKLQKADKIDRKRHEWTMFEDELLAKYQDFIDDEDNVPQGRDLIQKWKYALAGIDFHLNIYEDLRVAFPIKNGKIARNDASADEERRIAYWLCCNLNIQGYISRFTVSSTNLEEIMLCKKAVKTLVPKKLSARDEGMLEIMRKL